MFVLVFSGCDKENIIPDKQAVLNPDKSRLSDLSLTLQTELVSKEIRLRDGRLVFKDTTAFISTMRKLLSMKYAELVEWEKSMKHQSLRSTYSKLDYAELFILLFQEDKQQTNQILFVPDERFATILNEDGVFQIGNDIHKITKEIEYIFSESDEHILISEQFDSPKAKKFQIMYTKQSISNGRTEGSGNMTGYVYNDLNGNPLPNNTALFYSQFNVAYSTYASCGATSIYLQLPYYWYPVHSIRVEGSTSGYVEVNGNPASTPFYISLPLVDVRPNDFFASVTLFSVTHSGQNVVKLNLFWMNSRHTALYQSGASIIADISL